MRLSYRCNAEVFVPDYRLAPEHPYPAAFDDALAAWKFVKGLRPNTPIFVAGDSAGGGLSLSLLARLRDLGMAMPNGAFLLSPWTDLTASGASVDGNRGKDLWFTRRHLEIWAGYYAAGADRRSPYLSPVFADASGLPPLLLLVGQDELLLDDALRVRDAAASAGTEVRVHIGKGMQHDWPLTLPWLHESRLAWSAMRNFVEERAAANADEKTWPRECLEAAYHSPAPRPGFVSRSGHTPSGPIFDSEAVGYLVLTPEPKPNIEFVCGHREGFRRT
jgi:acetyl esterase/lipase